MSILSPSFSQCRVDDDDEGDDDIDGDGDVDGDCDDDLPSASAVWHVGCPQKPRNVGLLLGQT